MITFYADVVVDYFGPGITRQIRIEMKANAGYLVPVKSAPAPIAWPRMISERVH